MSVADSSTHRERGKAYLDQDNYDAATKEFTEAIRIDPRCSQAYTGRGDSYWWQGQFDLAAKDYSEAISLDPKNSSAYVSRGDTYWYQDLSDLAMKAYDKAISLDPGNSYAYTTRGDAHLQQNEYDKAINDFNKAIRLDKNNSEARNNLSLAIKQRDENNEDEEGDEDEAEEDDDESEADRGFYFSVATVGKYSSDFRPDSDEEREKYENQETSKIGKGRTVNIVRMNEDGTSCEQLTREGFFECEHENIVDDINKRLPQRRLRSKIVSGCLVLLALPFVYNLLKANGIVDMSVSRTSVAVYNEYVPKIQTNINLPTIYTGINQVSFFPDKIFYIHDKWLRVVSYEDLEITLSGSQFRESEYIPSDAERLGHTWKYVNNDGSPDKRFNNNRRIPVLRYCDIKIESTSGFCLTLMTSNFEIGEAFANALHRYKTHYKDDSQ